MPTFVLRCVVIALVAVASTSSSYAGGKNQIPIGSQADLWRQRDAHEKAAYLDGICDGLNAGKLLAGEIMCAPLEMTVKDPAKAKQHPGFRLCGIRWPHMSYGKTVSQNGIQVLDAYYRQPDHSDVPVDLAITAYNDKVCHEEFSAAAVRRVQAVGKCYRQLDIMAELPAEAQAAQKAVCEKIK